MRDLLRHLAARALDFPRVADVLTRDRKSLAVIFALHRFQDQEKGICGTPPNALRELLADLRRKKIRPISLGTLLEMTEQPDPPPGPWVAFTLDDGYEDQIRVGLPILQEFDVPATLFPVTGFLDGRIWPWWDQVEHLIMSSDSRPPAGTRLAEQLGLPTLEARFSSVRSPVQRRELASAVLEAFKTLSAKDRKTALRLLADLCRVRLPVSAPSPHRAASWDDIRRWEQAGFDCGCHTDSHPILARESEADLRSELESSWTRLTTELHAPLPILAFPNGRWERDFGAREVDTARSVGFRWGLSGDSGYLQPVGRQPNGETPDNRGFRVPRCFLASDRPSISRLLAGLAPIPRLVLGDHS